MKIIESIAKDIDLNDRQSLIENAITSLASKVVNQYSQILAPIAVDSVLQIVNSGNTINGEIDLKDIRVSKKIGGTIEDTEIINGLVFTHNRVNNTI
ncbi:MAG: hypothetical protein GY861_28900 [bacterium]|nr:hypothetical protein [bacterium]